MANDVVDLIMNDHRELERIFEELLNEPAKRPTLVPVMITLLTAHSRAEEAEVYPAALEAGVPKVDHSQKEHLEADQLALEVSKADPESPGFTEALQRLVDAVKHHVEEEESTVLPGMREKLPAEQLTRLADAFLASREENLGDMPEDLTRAEMLQQAENAGIEGTSGMSKAELKKKLAENAES